MQTERQREAVEFQAQGGQRGQEIRAKADREVTVLLAASTAQGEQVRGVVSRIFRTLVWAERRPALAQAVIAPLICWSFSSSMFKYLLVDHAVPAMCRSLAAARFSAD
jgi:hypothetical protein